MPTHSLPQSSTSSQLARSAPGYAKTITQVIVGSTATLPSEARQRRFHRHPLIGEHSNLHHRKHDGTMSCILLNLKQQTRCCPAWRISKGSGKCHVNQGFVGAKSNVLVSRRRATSISPTCILSWRLPSRGSQAQVCCRHYLSNELPTCSFIHLCVSARRFVLVLSAWAPDGVGWSINEACSQFHYTWCSGRNTMSH